MSMKKSMILLACASVALLSGCAGHMPRGMLVTDVTLPYAVTANSGKVENLKVGKSKCTDLLSWIAYGDASVATAMKDGGISKVHFVDWKAQNILGLVGEYECTVYGE